MYQKNSTKKEKQVKGKRSKTETVGSILKIHQTKGCEYLFHMWKGSNGKWYTCRSFHPKERRRLMSLLPRRQRSRPMLQLQHKSGRKSIHVWAKTRRGKGKRVIRSKTKKR